MEHSAGAGVYHDPLLWHDAVSFWGAGGASGHHLCLEPGRTFRSICPESPRRGYPRLACWLWSRSVWRAPRDGSWLGSRGMRTDWALSDCFPLAILSVLVRRPGCCHGLDPLSRDLYRRHLLVCERAGQSLCHPDPDRRIGLTNFHSAFRLAPSTGGMANDPLVVWSLASGDCASPAWVGSFGVLQTVRID